MAGLYRVQVSTRIAEVDAAAWDQVVATLAHPYLDRRFLGVVERTLTEPGRFWYAVWRDASNSAVAIAVYSVFDVDGGLFFSEAAQTRLASWRKTLGQRLFTFRLLLVGTPVTTGESGLAFLPETNVAELLPDVDRLAKKFGREAGAYFVTVKEYTQATRGSVAGLESLGYRYAESALTWMLENRFTSFDDYYNSRTKRTRANMRKYMKRFSDAGLTTVQFLGERDAVADRFPDSAHALYVAVFQKAAIKFERLPAEFFREIARAFGDDSQWTFVFRGDEIVGFVMSIHHPRMHTMLLCGMDYTVNAETDLYFNLIYRALDLAIQAGAPQIRVGASADEFKMRLGSTPLVLGFFVKSIRWYIRLEVLFPILFPGLSKAQQKYLEAPQPEADAAQ